MSSRDSRSPGRPQSVLAGLALLAAACVAAAPAAAQGPFAGRWIVTAVEPAPWLPGHPGARAHNNPEMRRARIAFLPDRLEAPGGFVCRNPRYRIFPVPPEGLFEGGLHDPARGLTDAAGLAARLGFPVGDSTTVEVRCHALRFHMSGQDRVLFALDNAIYILTRDK